MEDNNKGIHNWFLHIDLDAFFASVEQLDNPSYRGFPVIVGGHKEDKRGVVSTASYEARKFGVHSAMPIFKAIKLCPQGIYVRPRMKRYAELSFQIMNIFRDFSPDVEQMSIDEAFIDLTGTEQLFGPPEETALKIKKRVKELTGLTVSIGLATTKYLAKIASGYSKPNGFYFIKPGEEKNFMLSLPLKKVWGIGTKTLERLNKTGIKTTRDIYEKDYDLLEFMFGSTMARFLYDVVRGEEKESFSKKRKSHSISAEQTFSNDINDIYTAETQLMELAHGVMFRLLKEEKYSRTVTVKIKYDDFTSVSIQKTLERNIITLDSFFDNIKMLFEQKYQQGRGIRLLGVGFDKVENEDKPFQQSLFDNKDDKKQAIEKAILGLNKKHPEIKIQKARLLKSFSISLLIFSQFIFNKITPLESQELPVATPLFNWEINDKNNVDFTIDGTWQVGLNGDFTSTYGKNINFSVIPSMPIFAQDVELYTLFSINKMWYVEGNFADNFSNNTLTFGYKGKENSYFRSGKISNRNITMPNSYSSETFGFGLSGGNNQAPGFSAHWQSPLNKWSGDLLFRYDMTMPKSATFYGMNKVNTKIIDIKNYLYGHSFTFPQETSEYFLNIKDVYVESDTGNYKDLSGKKYLKLSNSDFIYDKLSNILYISQKGNGNKKGNKIPTILVTFISPDATTNIINSINYNSPETFAGKIQEEFNKSNRKINLQDFTYKLETKIQNSPALVIQNSSGFSPFLIANTYDLGTEKFSQKGNSLLIISKSSGQPVSNYVAEIGNKSYTNNYEDFLFKNHIYGYVTNKNSDFNQYPFASQYPELYLNLKSDTDLAIENRSFSPINEINIGKKASGGTIQVLRNGINEQNFIYDINKGTIELTTPISPTDQIKITWQEEASDFSKGNFVLGLGFQLNILPEMQWDISLTAQKPLTFDYSYSTPDNVKNSFLALSTGIKYKKDNFSVSDKAAFSIQNPNDSGKLLISTTLDSSEKIHELTNTSGFETINNFKINNIEYKIENNCSTKNHSGIKDKSIKGYKIPLQWNFRDFKGIDNRDLWASVDIQLNGGNFLKNSSSIQLALQLSKTLPQDLYKVYLQMGIKAGENAKEPQNYMPLFDITSQIDFTQKKWQIINIDLSDKDRAFLVSNYDIRLVVIPDKNKMATASPENLNGIIFAGPYSGTIESIFTSAHDDIYVKTSSIPTNDNFYASKISWNYVKNKSPNNKIITAIKNIAPADLSQYKTIKIKFAYKKIAETNNSPATTEPALTILLDSPSSDNNTPSLQLSIKDLSSYITTSETYHEIEINTENNTVSIDKIILQKENYTLWPIIRNIVPTRAVYKINTALKDKNIYSGIFIVHNITFEDSEPTLLFQNKADISYEKSDILTINDFPIFSDFSIEANSIQKISENNISVISFLNWGITIPWLFLQNDLSINQLNISNGGHTINTPSPILKTLSINESYRWNRTGQSIHKENNFNFTLNKYNIPVNIQSQLLAENSLSEKSQNHKTLITSDFNIKDVQINLKSSLETKQTINLIKNNISNFNVDNYFKDWYEITKLQFSLGDISASTRNSNFNNSISININEGLCIPTLQYNLSANYENISSPLITDKINLIFSIPITFNNNTISFVLDKTGGDLVPFNKKGNYFSDLEKLFVLQQEQNWFYSSLPFYELFDQNVRNKINGNYSSKYEINYNRKLSNSFEDLFIPSFVSLAVIRDIKSKDNFSDSYQIKASLSNRSINNLGNQSQNKLFKWFAQEELLSGITTIVKVPTDKPENISFHISGFLQLLLLINERSVINSTFDFLVETNSSWNVGGAIVYSRPGTTSFITSLINYFSEKTEESNFNIFRKDSFNFQIGTVNNIHQQQYSYNHNIDIGFLNYFTISSGLGCTYKYIENQGNSIGITYSIAGKVSF